MKKTWMWTGITLGVLVLLGILLSPLTNPGRNDQQGDGFMQQTPVPGTQVRQQLTDSTDDQSDPERLRKRVVNAAMSVEGVKEAWGLALGNTAVVGVKLESMIQGAAKQITLDEVADQVRELPNIAKAAVTQDPELVERIRKIGEQLVKGEPASKFTSDITELIRKITPSS